MQILVPKAAPGQERDEKNVEPTSRETALIQNLTDEVGHLRNQLQSLAQSHEVIIQAALDYRRVLQDLEERTLRLDTLETALDRIEERITQQSTVQSKTEPIGDDPFSAAIPKDEPSPPNQEVKERDSNSLPKELDDLKLQLERLTKSDFAGVWLQTAFGIGILAFAVFFFLYQISLIRLNREE